MTKKYAYNEILKAMQKMNSIDLISLNKRKINQKLLNEAYIILDNFKTSLLDKNS